MSVNVIVVEDIQTEAITQYVQCLANNQEVTIITTELDADELDRRVKAQDNPTPKTGIDAALRTVPTVIIAETGSVIANRVITAQPESTRIILITGDASKVFIPEDYTGLVSYT